MKHIGYMDMNGDKRAKKSQPQSMVNETGSVFQDWLGGLPIL